MYVRLANGQHSDELIDCCHCFQLNVCVSSCFTETKISKEYFTMKHKYKKKH